MNVEKSTHWLKKNLFRTKLESCVSILIFIVIIYIISQILSWGIINATLTGDSMSECSTKGACWIFVKVHLEQFIYGFYPSAELWRINLTFIIFILIPIFSKLKIISIKQTLAILFIIFPALALILLHGGIFSLPLVSTDKWGGLFLTLIIAISGIIFAFPLGILTALGRRSALPVIKLISTLYIELIRGVPLISILFMASVMFPLFMPEGIYINKLLRAIIAIILFQGAYLAEVVRGGLNALPKNQYDASKSLGLSYWPMMYCIILPQALRMIIPGIVNSQIALLKDTSLILIIGLFDFLGIVQTATTNSQWLGMNLEGYTFCALIYWICCFSMSQYSQRLEKKLNKDKYYG